MLPILEILVEGLLLGSIYSLAALGISLVFSVLNILNLAHGNLIMLGSVVAFIIFGLLGGSASGILGLATTLVLVLLIFAALGGVLEYGLIRPILRNPGEVLISAILVTIGLALVLQDVASYIFIRAPGNVSRTTTVSLTLPNFGSLAFGGYTFASSKFIALVVIVAAGIGLYVFFKRTYLGMAMRSISQDREAAVVVGVNLRQVSVVTFAVGTLFAGFAGLMLAIDQTADPVLGLGYTIKLLTIMVLGGVRSPIGPVIGGLILGVTEIGVGSLIDPYWTSAVSLVILISILLVRPTGIIGGGISRS